MVRDSKSIGVVGARPASFPSAVLWNGLALVFVTAALAIAGYAVYEFKFQSAADVRSLPTDPPASAGGEDFTIPPKEWLPFAAYAPDFSNRDIFKTDAQKQLEALQPPVAAASHAAFAAWGQGYQLSGVIVDREPRAVIRVLNPPGTQVLSLGEELNGAVLTKIEDNQIFFTYQGQTITLGFDQDGQK